MSYLEAVINKVKSIDDLLAMLGKFLDSTDYVMEKDGKEFLVQTKARVDSLNGYKIEIYPSEHNPPHFHVVKDNKKLAAYTIDNCLKINGELPANIEKKLKFFHRHSREKLANFWLETRPSTI